MLIDQELSYPQGEMYGMRDSKMVFPLFVGGYGCGKSHILVLNAIRDIMLFRGCKVGIYAVTLDLLDLNIIPMIEVWLDMLGIKYKMNKAKHVMKVQGNRMFFFRSMMNPHTIVAYSVYASHVDEVDLLPNLLKTTGVWNRIIARNRQVWRKPNGTKHKKHFNMVSAYSTPEGFHFTYERWSKNPGIGYKYIRSKTADNITNDDSYVTNLINSYTPEQCNAYLLGKWVNIFTGSVYSYFDRDTHLTDVGFRPKIDKLLYVGIDFNAGACCMSISVPIRIPQVEKVGLRVVDEQCSHDTGQAINWVLDKYGKWNSIHGNQIQFFPDATGDSANSNASESDIAMLEHEFGEFNIMANKTNPRINDRVNAVQNMLYNNTIEINQNLSETIGTLEQHAYSPINSMPEKFNKHPSLDDRSDCLGYKIAYLHPLREVGTNTFDI